MVVISAPARLARGLSAIEIPATRRPHVNIMLGKLFVLPILARGSFWFCEESLEERREFVERGVREKSEIAQDSSFKAWSSVEVRERSS